MPLKVTYLFDYQSIPQQGQDAASHKGGWSESIWQASVTPDPAKIRAIASARARLLPSSCRLIGYRQQVYTIGLPGLIAGGASIVLLGIAGQNTYAPDLPQVALSCVAQAAIYTNTRRFSLRGIPDQFMVNGEYQPSSAFRNNVLAYFQALVDNEALFIGRDLTQPIYPIESIIAGKMRTVGDIPVILGDRILLRRCRDNDGNVVTGTFTVTAIAGRDVTLGNFDAAITVGNKGTATVHYTVTRLINAVAVGRAVVRKVGRPFEQYRGRRSKRR